MKLTPSKRAFRFSLGDQGEALAAEHLVKNGFKILHKNYRCAAGEIDLIAEKNGRLHFIEVKTRRDGAGCPEEAVDAKKQSRLVRLASWYLREKNLHDPGISLDVIGVIRKAGGDTLVRLTEGAFEKGDSF